MSSTGASLQHDSAANQVGQLPVPRKPVGKSQTIATIFAAPVRENILRDWLRGVRPRKISRNYGPQRGRVSVDAIDDTLRYEISVRLKARVA